MSSSLAQWSALVGFLLPLIVAKIQNTHWSNELRTAVGVAACAVAAIVTTWIEGNLNVHNFGQSVIVIFMMTKTSYLAVWKPSGTTKVLERTDVNN